MKFLALASKLNSLALVMASKSSSPRKCPVFCLRTVLCFDLLKMGLGHEQYCFVLEHAKELAKKKIEDLSLWKTLGLCEKFAKFLSEDFFFVGEHFRVVSLVLGLEHSCPWPREGLSSEGVSLALTSDFFASLASSLVSSTTPMTVPYHIVKFW